MKIISPTPKRKKAKLNLMVPLSVNITLATESNATTIIVGINTQRRSKGCLSANNSKTPQEKATADMRPIGYTISVSPILSGINTENAMLKSAIAAAQ